MTNNANLAIQSNVEMQPAQPSVHLCKQCMWRHLVAKFKTNKSGAIWWPNLQVMQMMLSGGQICSQSKKCHLVAKLSLSHGWSQFLGPLCLWQCLLWMSQRSPFTHLKAEIFWSSQAGKIPCSSVVESCYSAGGTEAVMQSIQLQGIDPMYSTVCW